MKKITSILAGCAIILAGCSKDEIEQGAKTDALVGNWQIKTQSLQEGQSGEPQDITDPCAHLNLFRYKTDGTFSVDNVFYDTKSKGCVDAKDDNGTWTLLEDGVYEIKSPGKPTIEMHSTFTTDRKGMTMQFTMGATTYTYLMEKK